MLKKISKFLGSLRLTITLIISLGVIFLLGLWIPQKGIIDYEAYRQWKANVPTLVAFIEAMGLMEIYRAPLTLALWGCFFINLSLVMWQRIPVVRRRIALPDPLPDPLGTSFPHHAAIELSGPVTIDAVSRVLGKAGYACHGTTGRFYAVKNRLSPVATLLFHLSFFLMLMGGVISVYTRFVGTVDLAEGEVFNGELERYTGKPSLPRFGSPPALRLVVRKVTPLIEGQTPTGLRVTLEDDRYQRQTIDINKPYRRGDISFVVKDLGLAPLIIMRDASGREMDGAFVKLNVLRGKEDGFRMGGYTFRARFFPDHVLVNGEDQTRSEEFRNPVLAIMAEQGGRRTVQRVPYLAGTRLPIDGVTLELSRLSYWVRFTVVREQGVWLVYAGFLIACGALLWRLVWYRRELAGAVTQAPDGSTTMHIAFRSEFYRALAEEEFDMLKGRINRDLL